MLRTSLGFRFALFGFLPVFTSLIVSLSSACSLSHSLTPSPALSHPEALVDYYRNHIKETPLPVAQATIVLKAASKQFKSKKTVRMVPSFSLAHDKFRLLSSHSFKQIPEPKQSDSDCCF